MNKLILVVLAALVAVAFMPSTASAEDVTVVGTVSVVKAPDGAVTSVTVKADDGAVTTVKVDDNGKAVANLDGKKAKVVGTMEKDGDAQVLVVKKSEAAE